jgi:hypothetical protein
MSGVLQGPTINHIINIDYLMEAQSPQVNQTLLSARTFQGLVDYLPGVWQGPNLGLECVQCGHIVYHLTPFFAWLSSINWSEDGPR